MVIVFSDNIDSNNYLTYLEEFVDSMGDEEYDNYKQNVIKAICYNEYNVIDFFGIDNVQGSMDLVQTTLAACNTKKKMVNLLFCTSQIVQKKVFCILSTSTTRNRRHVLKSGCSNKKLASYYSTHINFVEIERRHYTLTYHEIERAFIEVSGINQPLVCLNTLDTAGVFLMIYADIIQNQEELKEDLSTQKPDIVNEEQKNNGKSILQTTPCLNHSKLSVARFKSIYGLDLPTVSMRLKFLRHKIYLMSLKQQQGAENDNQQSEDTLGVDDGLNDVLMKDSTVTKSNLYTLTKPQITTLPIKYF